MCPGPEDSYPRPGLWNWWIPARCAESSFPTDTCLITDQNRRLQDRVLSDVELVDNTARICVMNLLLHGIGRPDGESPIHSGGRPGLTTSGGRYSIVLTNPPFGRRSSITVIGADGVQQSESH